MTTAPTAARPGTGLLSPDIDPEITCNFCKKPGHTKDECRKLKRKEIQIRNDDQNTKKGILNARIVKKQTSRRNGVGKEQEPTSNLKTSD